MKLVAFLVAVVATASSLVSTHSPHSALHKRQDALSGERFIVTGATGEVHTRLEIRTMATEHPPQFNLFLLALRRFMDRPESDPTSYYQISGIHGLPRQDYNGVAQCADCSAADGYCTHASVLFPSWHRAYIAFFEQEFLKVVNQVANEFPDEPTSSDGYSRAQMQDAAGSMRYPYWDWAAQPPGPDALPGHLTRLHVNVQAPDGPVKIQNPLFRYDFRGDTSDMVYIPFSDWNRTYRYASAYDETVASQQPVAQFNFIRANLAEQVYRLLTACGSYMSMSNGGQATESCPNSLESIHDTVHTAAGGTFGDHSGGGHMALIPTAAFDPMFWLHHVNVDRLVAIWQGLHPDQWGASHLTSMQSWTIAKNTTQDADSPLTPFYKDSDTFWTSNDVRNWQETFRYDYPEFVDTAGDRGALIDAVNTLYGPGASIQSGKTKRRRKRSPRAHGDEFHADNSATADDDTIPMDDGLVPHIDQHNASRLEYSCDLQTTRFGLNGSYAIYVFLDQPADEASATWIGDENLVGPMGIFAKPGMADMDFRTSGSVPLTRTLQARVAAGHLASLREVDVVPYLQRHLVWRVAGARGESLDPHVVPGFDAAVRQTPLQLGGYAGCAPRYGVPVLLEDVTRHKPGGRGCVGMCQWGQDVASLSSPRRPVVTVTTTVCRCGPTPEP